MTDNAQPYVSRMLAFVGDADPLRELAEAPARLRALVERADAATRAHPPAPGKWSINQIAAHMADNEVVAGYRIRMILGDNGTPLQVYDQDAWAATLKYDQVDALESAELFASFRHGTLRLLRRIDPPRLEHYGMHPERGRETVAHLIRFYAGHDVNHLRQIERILGVGL